MPATISSSGTWTNVEFNTTDVAKTMANDARLSEISFYDSLRDTDFSELQQFIQLVANAYSIGFWAAAVLVDNALQIMRNRGVPQRNLGQVG